MGAFVIPAQAGIQTTGSPIEALRDDEEKLLYLAAKQQLQQGEREELSLTVHVLFRRVYAEVTP